MKTVLTILSVSLSALLAACATTDQIKEKSDASAAFVVGKTTRDDVEKLFGPPHSVTKNQDGTTSAVFKITDGLDNPLFGKASSLIGVIGAFVPIGSAASSALSTANQVQGTAAAANYGVATATGTAGKLLICQYLFDRSNILTEGGGCTSTQ